MITFGSQNLSQLQNPMIDNLLLLYYEVGKYVVYVSVGLKLFV